MADHDSTPGSTADNNSVNGVRSGASKDKQCPFCSQHFTSSSLGRHLDLYIKEKNPKPADGMHDVEQIRKMRGGITRRQPRNSMSKREESTPAATPVPSDRRSPAFDSDAPRSPSVRRDLDSNYYDSKQKILLNKATWETTGVINNIPPARNSNSLRSFDGDDKESGRRFENRHRSASKQILAKTTFDQKQKMVEALDSAKAAELALRELLGGIRAAKQRIEGPSIFDYDPLSLDFPSLTLHCLPPPPTLNQTHPLATSSSWSISPPDDTQYQALRAHFSTTIHNWRMSCAIATTAPREDFSYPPPVSFQQDDTIEIVHRAEVLASELETKISTHLHQVFAHWNSLSTQTRSEFWTLELARSIGRKSNELQMLRKEKELAEQEVEHLRMQVNDLSRLQYPREFKVQAPHTLPIDSKTMAELTASGLSSTRTSVGFNLMDRNVHLDTAIERAIGRWRDVVKEARGVSGSGLTAQRSLSGDSSLLSPHTNMTQPKPAQSPQNPSTEVDYQNQNQHRVKDHSHATATTAADLTMGSDEDADADGEVDDFAMNDVPPPLTHPNSQRNPSGSLAKSGTYHYSNGNSNQGHGDMDGLENTNGIQGYVRIGVS